MQGVRDGRGKEDFAWQGDREHGDTERRESMR